GSSTDIQSEGFRRLLINSVFWGGGIDVPKKANVDYVGEYKPTPFGFNKFTRGVKPADHKLKK
ncbi:MAG: hypothetical protein AAF517_12530, partial [Planctomycetota bacterium]